MAVQAMYQPIFYMSPFAQFNAMPYQQISLWQAFYKGMMDFYYQQQLQMQQMLFSQQLFRSPMMQQNPCPSFGSWGMGMQSNPYPSLGSWGMQSNPQSATEKPDKEETSKVSDASEDNKKAENKDKKKTAPETQTLTPELKDKIIKGTYTGDYVKINGITHYRYKDCDKSKVVSVDNGQQLHKDAAAAFNKMKEAAAKDGISLHVHSGLRTSTTQKDLFSNKMKTKNRSFEQNLKWSAPSGFSEHHTGLAMDINCASSSFGSSKEYKWLKEHAKDYGFELSFPENNAQGVGFEPWHWRYIGTNGEYKSVFAAARDNDKRFS